MLGKKVKRWQYYSPVYALYKNRHEFAPAAATAFLSSFYLSFFPHFASVHEGARAQSESICGAWKKLNSPAPPILIRDNSWGHFLFTRRALARRQETHLPTKLLNGELINRSSQSERGWLKPSPARARTPSSSSSVDDSRDAARWEWIKRCCKRLEICSLQGNKMTAVPPSWMAKVGWFARAWHVFKWEFIHKCASRASPCMQEQRSSSWLFFFSKSKHVFLKKE